MDNEETVRCPRFDSSDVIARKNVDENRKQYLCRTCEERESEPKYFTYRTDLQIPEYKSTKFPGARILLFDIETAPMEVYAWAEKSAQGLAIFISQPLRASGVKTRAMYFIDRF